MKHHLTLLTALFGLCLSVQPLAAQGEKDAIHNELRAMKASIVKAMNARDIEGIVVHLSPNVVFTTMNGDVARGHQGLRDYMAKMLTGPSAVVEDVKVDLTPADLSILSLDDRHAVSWGTTKDSYKLRAGTNFDIEARWSASAIKENGKWVLDNIHYSTNIFDNPVLSASKKLTLWAALATGVAGLVIGWLTGRRGGKRPA